MWFIGLVIGMLLGGIVGQGAGALVGGLLGAIIGAVASALSGGSRHAALEARIAALERSVDALRRASPGVAQADTAGATVHTATPAAPAPEPEVAPPIEAIAAGARAAAAPRVESAPEERPSAPLPGMAIWQWLSGGNALVRVGVVLLFFGVAFLLKYAYEHTQIPIEARLIAVALGALAMLVIGWRLRARNPVYALAIQGGGVGLLYLTVFGAFRLFNLIPGEAAFVLLVAIAVLSAMLAVLQDALSLAVLGISGGFLAPVLASTGSGSHVMLFSYYALLNLGILAIALYRAWRPLNLLGFVFTFGIGALWGTRFYRPELFTSTEPFLILFFVLYVAIAVIFALRQAPLLKHYVDGTIVFGTPLVGFGLQTQLVGEFEYGAAWSALAAAALYLALASLLYRRHQEKLRMLVEAFLALGVIFATLAIPLAFEGRWTSAAWALEGAAAYWVGVRQVRRLPRAFGLLLQFAAGIAFLVDVGRGFGSTPILNSFTLGCVLIAGAALFSNRTIERHAEQVGHFAMQTAVVVFVWGLGWWLLGGLHEIHLHVPYAERGHATLLFLAASCAAFSLLSARGWWIARYPALALAPLMLLALGVAAQEGWRGHPLAGLGLAAWPVAFVLHLNILHRHDELENRYMTFAHAAGLWLLAAVGAWELGWQIDQAVAGRRVWPLIAWALAPGVLLAALALGGERIAWPVMRRPRAYLWIGVAPLAAFLWAWTLYANFSNDGDPAPLPYLPLVNPLDIAQMLGFTVLVLWWRALRDHAFDAASPARAAWPAALLGAAGFVFLNGVLLRTLHHWAEIPYRLHAMLRSDLVQTSLSIFWTVLALAAMLFATRRALRSLWFTGAALMAVVVVKLFLVELAKMGGVERIVSFIAVGILMLVIGYVAPIPPKHPESA